MAVCTRQHARPARPAVAGVLAAAVCAAVQAQLGAGVQRDAVAETASPKAAEPLK